MEFTKSKKPNLPSDTVGYTDADAEATKLATLGLASRKLRPLGVGDRR
jgi:hypothetical protein